MSGHDHDVVSINGYSILKLKLPSQPAFRTPAWHHLYLRRHESKLPSLSDDRTLFVVNVPVDATEAHFRTLFTRLGHGRIESVRFDRTREASTPTVTPILPTKEKNKKRKRVDEEDADEQHTELPETWDREIYQSGSTALIVFADRASLNATLKALNRTHKRPLIWGEGLTDTLPELGSHRYYVHHRMRYPPRIPLQASVDAFMTRHAALETQQARQAKRLRQEPDEEGFITVTRGGRTGPARMEEAQAAAERQKKKSEEGLKNFYRFQLREERKKAQGEMLRRFEEDRRKVDEMRKKRRSFRPE
ncbi:MAG: hypothetical protein M1823_003095 [Watsoniomyces obsoletus]|nr:MAG: hypothetical protein M1823_003095 [Watsoniomyces obsoletus]